MASGSYRSNPASQEPHLTAELNIPLRATRQLLETVVEEKVTETGIFFPRLTANRALVPVRNIEKPVIDIKTTTAKVREVVEAYRPHPLAKHRPWLTPLNACIAAAVIFLAVLLSSSIVQRPGGPQLVSLFGGQAYNVQPYSWQINKPLPPKVPLPAQTGPYGVLGKPTLTVDFMNQVLASYNSPAAGKAQALYDLGVKYGIDPAFALAFFLHESSFGTAGEARKTLSLGNLRCIPNANCVDQDRGGYAAFPTWEAGFEAWYMLIRNLYVAQRGLVTVEQIIPVYAPNSDNNNEQGYINSLKHSLDTWHGGALRP